MSTERLPDDPELFSGFTARQVRCDYRCELGVQASALDELDKHREALRQMEQERVEGVQKNIRQRAADILEKLHRAYDRVFHILEFKEHLALLFKRYEVENPALLEHIDRTHPCRKDLKKITRKLRELAEKRDEDVRRMKLLLHVASRLAGADHKMQKDEKQVLKSMLSDRRWKKRLKREASRRTEMDRENGGSSTAE